MMTKSHASLGPCLDPSMPEFVPIKTDTSTVKEPHPSKASQLGTSIQYLPPPVMSSWHFKPPATLSMPTLISTESVPTQFHTMPTVLQPTTAMPMQFLKV